MSKVYERPMLKKVTLKNEQTVANTCWGYHGSNTKLFCDLPDSADGDTNTHVGYVSFQIGGSSCTMNLVNVTYYDGTKDVNGNLIGQAIKDNDNNFVSIEGIASTSKMYDSLVSKLKTSGGESGNPFAGEGKEVFPNKPEPTFS